MNRKPDFPTIIRTLSSKGMTTRQIAQKIGASPTAVDRIKNHEVEPKYSVGSSLVILSQE